ncbi:MAG TPA: lipopolysaccharide heptosyltransferase II [Acidiferrobacteraceae bacterium]|nr:lipopolysaccharide heptosyltransferase II [Acidiferrobacteraceae bacterium]
MPGLCAKENILVIGPSWIGDMVLAHSLFQVIRRRLPHGTLDVVAPSWSASLLMRMPEVDGVVELDCGHGKLGLVRRYTLGRKLRRRHYSQAIVLPNSFKSGLVPHWAGIPHRTGYRSELRGTLFTDYRRLDKQALPRLVDRFVALGVDANALLPRVPMPRLQVSTHQRDDALGRLGLARPQNPLLILCPGAEYGPAKCWPPDHYGAVARHYIDQGWMVWVVGSARDRSIAEKINSLVGGRCTNLVAMTSLLEAVELLSLADQVLSNDSGLMHVAAALGRPVVALFGSSDPGYTPPLGDQVHILSLDLACRPCFKRECPLGHGRCLTELKPSQVIRAMKDGVKPANTLNLPTTSHAHYSEAAC